MLVIAKALIVTLAFGLLLAIRRPRYSLWHWGIVTCVGVLAAIPQFTLRPPVVSMFFLAVTLYLLFRMPRTENRWRFPIAIGITFCLWANCDEWFFLGPLALLLVLVGEVIQSRFLDGAEEDTEDPLGPLPETATLARALGIGVLACMLTPHHVRIWELPFELVGADGARADPQLRQWLVHPYDSLYTDNAGWGNNVNGLAYAVLVLGGAALLGFGFGRLRAAHVALWVGFLFLSLMSIYAIPFFAIVAVPLIAAQLNAIGARAELKTWGDPKSRLFWIGSSLGRIASVVAVCVLCVAAYPGWVHPEISNPAYAQRIAWGVEADPLLAQAARQLDRWRELEKLPPGTRGIIASPAFANYVAWFAPREKVFLNIRYNLHRRELADYLQLRKGLGLSATSDQLPDRNDASEVMKKWTADYVAISALQLQSFLINREVAATAATG